MRRRQHVLLGPFPHMPRGSRPYGSCCCADYAGYDIQGVQARDALQCAGECIKVPGCNVYSYSLNDQRCYLKKAAGKSTRAVATFVAGYVARPLTTAVAAGEDGFAPSMTWKQFSCSERL